ncbi:DUF4411 family protein [Ochrobactrum quorumnocens]|uniref:DUF4411 family protein n=1 Tax=Ochrobactrum quorumnocens TaxID=271865 RepID=A0A5N1JFK6_9HYPH|nr:DUF4411 family protein [[Ochrobactrum] quorumnocens]KAA9354266.1 DUF4411 family protein [[Ochrobactrum] quorumnocens]
MRFLVDSNIFIEAKNRYYGFDICPGFWEWMDDVCGNGVGSIVEVRNELLDGRDELADWISDRKDAEWFLQIDDEETQNHFADVANHVAMAGYSDAAVEKFLAKADPWIIAKSMTLGSTIVTHETVAQANARNRVLIPNVCNHFGVPYLNTFDALRQMAASFNLHRP